MEGERIFIRKAKWKKRLSVATVVSVSDCIVVGFHAGLEICLKFVPENWCVISYSTCLSSHFLHMTTHTHMVHNTRSDTADVIKRSSRNQTKF